MQLGQELGYVFGERKINNNSIYLPAKCREFNLSGGLLNNFSLFYKFLVNIKLVYLPNDGG
jgi:hypothetical protein